MELIYKNIIGEIFSRDTDYRLYCEDISLRREKEIIDELGDSVKVIEKCEGNFDKSFIVDFEEEMLEAVKSLIDL